MTDQVIAAEQNYLDGLFARVEELREETRRELAAVGRTDDATPQGLLDRDARAARLAGRRDVLNHAENGLCFGNLQHRDGALTYIGRIGLRGADLEPLLVDWRAPAAAEFYTATAGSGSDLVRRRHIRTRGREVVGVNDELLDLDRAPDSGLVGEAALMEALTSRRTGRMNQIVATLQAEQDAIIRSSPEGALVVQGGPGTGKTVVALHRTAYLLYTHPQIAQRGVLVMGPNPAFLTYISEVLPALGETHVVLATPQDLVPGYQVRGTEGEAPALIKGRLDAAKLISRAVQDRQGSSVGVSLTFDGDVYHLPPQIIGAAVQRARRAGLLHNQARAVFRQAVLEWLTEEVLAAGEQLLDQVEEGFEAELAGVDRALSTGSDALPGAVQGAGTEVTGTIAGHEVNHLRRELLTDPKIAGALAELWPELTAGELLEDLFADPVRLADAGGHLPAAERAALHRPRGQGWTVADIPLLDEAAELLGAVEEELDPRAPSGHQLRDAEQVLASSGAAGIVTAADLAQRYEAGDHRSMAEKAAADRTWAYGHVVVDEAQELSPMQWRMISRRVPIGSMTIVGDVHQTFAVDGLDAWDQLDTAGVGGNSQRQELTVNYRTPREVMEVAGPVLRALDPGARAASSVRASGTTPWAVQVRATELVQAVAGLARTELSELAGGNLAVITSEEHLPDIAAAVAQAVPGASGGTRLDLASICVTITPQQAKGLEFDGVIVAAPADILSGSRGLNALYVALTRPMRRLGLVHPGPVPEFLAGVPPRDAVPGGVGGAT